jgi:hypothetical protein
VIKACGHSKCAARCKKILEYIKYVQANIEYIKYHEAQTNRDAHTLTNVKQVMYVFFVSEIMQSAAYICTLWSTRMDKFDNVSSNVHIIDMARAITELAIEQ